MFLTNCAACAAPLGLSLGKKCSRCKTRYCGPACQKQHWDAGGHKDFCKLIKKGGGAEQYHANKKFKEAVAIAVEKCADDTKGQTCYICLQAVHPRTGEGLVRGCACGDRDGVASGRTGVAHVSCLAEQAKVLVEEAKENNMDRKAFYERWKRWNACSLCEQQYHGYVKCAVAWACWKTYASRMMNRELVLGDARWSGTPEAEARGYCGYDICLLATVQLGRGLFDARRYAEALDVFESFLSYHLGRGLCIEDLGECQTNVANCYVSLGREDEALSIYRRVYKADLDKSESVDGHDNIMQLFNSALNLCTALVTRESHDEVPPILRPLMPAVQRELGPEHELTLRLRTLLGDALAHASATGSEGHMDGLSILEDALLTSRRVLGPTHPRTLLTRECLAKAFGATLPAPRFKVGARVECRMDDAGNFFKGTVVCHHYRECHWESGLFAPYQVKLDEGFHGIVPENDVGLIFALADDDQTIRAAASESSDEPAAPSTSDDDDAATV